MINKILAIQNCGPSGTTLLQSLFDNHPQILSLPALHGQELLIFWERYVDLNKQELYDRFMADCAHFYDPEKMNNALGLMDMGVNRDEKACIDKELYQRYLKEEWDHLETITRKDFLVGVYRAYNRALGRSINEESYLLYPIHCLPKKYADWLVEDFSEVKFLHSIREPLQSIGSLAKHITKNPGWDPLHLLTCTAAQMLCDTTIHVGLRPAHGVNAYVQDRDDGTVETRAIKLEDIHRDTRTTLTKVCEWLKISWSDTLLVSTFNGKLWHNRAESIRQSGIGTQTLAQHHSDIISNFDRLRLNYLAKPFKDHFGYVMTPTVKNSKILSYMMPILLYLPFKMEFVSGRFQKQIKSNQSKWLKTLKQNVMDYMACRKKWLLPAWRAMLLNKPTNYVKLL